MTAKIIPFVPRKVADGKPMVDELSQAALEILLQLSVPKCHDDLEGGSVLEYETSLGYPKEPA